MNKTKQKIRSKQITIKKNIFKNWKEPHCEYCGNSNKDILQLHHIIPICDGGNNDIDNLIILCPNCHKMVHTKQIDTQELINIKTEKLTSHVEKLKQHETKLNASIQQKEKTIEKLKNLRNYLVNEINNKQKILSELDACEKTNKTYQLYQYINKLEYKYNNLLEENKNLLKENEQLKQSSISKLFSFIKRLTILFSC